LYQILWEGSYKERKDKVLVLLRSIEECGSNGQKLRKPATVYILYFYIVGVASVGDKTPQIRFREELYSLSLSLVC